MTVHRPPLRDLEAWLEERRFIQELIDQGPLPGKRTWKRADLYDRSDRLTPGPGPYRCR